MSNKCKCGGECKENTVNVLELARTETCKNASDLEKVLKESKNSVCTMVVYNPETKHTRFVKLARPLIKGSMHKAEDGWHINGGPDASPVPEIVSKLMKDADGMTIPTVEEIERASQISMLDSAILFSRELPKFISAVNKLERMQKQITKLLKENTNGSRKKR